MERWDSRAHDRSVVRVPSCAFSPPATYVPSCAQEHFAGHIYSEMRRIPTMKPRAFFLLSACRSKTASYTALQFAEHLLAFGSQVASHRETGSGRNSKDMSGKQGVAQSQQMLRLWAVEGAFGPCLAGPLCCKNEEDRSDGS